MRWVKLVLVTGIAAGIGSFAGMMICWLKSAETVTTTRLSPDETLRVRLIETSPSANDRTFMLQLESLVEGTKTQIYKSPDEGRPEGTERLIWSKDGKWFLLVGRHFFVKEDLFLDNGDQIYFLCHVPSKKAWVNSDQPEGLPSLTAARIEGIEFTEPIRLKPR
jgi:hypothetical protein